VQKKRVKQIVLVWEI